MPDRVSAPAVNSTQGRRWPSFCATVSFEFSRIARPCSSTSTPRDRLKPLAPERQARPGARRPGEGFTSKSEPASERISMVVVLPGFPPRQRLARELAHAVGTRAFLFDRASPQALTHGSLISQASTAVSKGGRVS